MLPVHCTQVPATPPQPHTHTRHTLTCQCLRSEAFVSGMWQVRQNILILTTLLQHPRFACCSSFSFSSSSFPPPPPPLPPPPCTWRAPRTRMTDPWIIPGLAAGMQQARQVTALAGAHTPPCTRDAGESAAAKDHAELTQKYETKKR